MIRRILNAWRARRDLAAFARSSRNYQRGWTHGMDRMRAAEDKAKEAAALTDCVLRERAFGTYNDFDKGVEGAVQECAKQERLMVERADRQGEAYDGISRAQYKAMFLKACEDIADIHMALGLEACKGQEPVLAAIADLQARRPVPDDAAIYEVMAACTVEEGDGMVLDHLRFARSVLARWAVQEATDADEVRRLRQLAATCYAGLGAECNLPEPWLDALSAAALGAPFSTDGLLPFAAVPARPETQQEVAA